MEVRALTLDEAIKHCEKVADDQDWLASSYDDGSMGKKLCNECASEHRQLADWLRELKAYRKILANADRIIESEYGCVIIEGYKDVIDQMNEVFREVNADKGVLDKINEKQDSLRATCKAWDEAISRDGYVD